MTDDPKDPHASWDDIIADAFRQAISAPLPLTIHSPEGSFGSALRAALEHLDITRVLLTEELPTTPRMRIEHDPGGLTVVLNPIWRQLLEEAADSLGRAVTIDVDEDPLA